MAKTTGLGDDLYVAGFHIGGDIRQVVLNGGPTNQLDVTDITQSAHSRLGGLRNGIGDSGFRAGGYGESLSRDRLNSFLGLPTENVTLPPPTLRRQADHHSQDWEARYRRIAAEEGR